MQNSSYTKQIGDVAISKHNNGKYIHSEVEAQELFELESEDLTFIEIKLLDGNDKQLRLNRGFPTFIKLVCHSIIVS